MRNFTTSLAVIVLLLTTGLRAEPGVMSNRILVGQSCVLKGIASDLGTLMATGMNVYFDHVNRNGGIKGRQIELITLNDDYEPLHAARNTRRLISKDSVFCLIGEVGTPTSKAVLPLVESEQVPFLAPFTGAELLRKPVSRYVINVRAGYNEEMEKLAEYLVEQKKISRIACFYQDDAYGKAGMAGLKAALKRRGLDLAGTGSYNRNSLAIQSGLASVRTCAPEAVVLVGAYMPCAVFIKSARNTPELKDAEFCNISFVGTRALKEALGSYAEGCIVSQVVPYPWDTSVPIVDEYQELMRAAGHGPDEIDFVSLEGFIAAKFFCAALAKIDGHPTREKLIDTIEQIGRFDLGGLSLQFGPDDHQGLDDVFLVEFRQDQITLVK